MLQFLSVIAIVLVLALPDVAAAQAAVERVFDFTLQREVNAELGVK